MRQGEAHNLGLGEFVQGFGDAFGVGDGAVGVEGVSFAVGLLGPRGDEFGAERPERVEDHIIIAYCLGGVGGSVIELRGEFEILFAQLGKGAEVDVFEQKLYVVVIRVEVWHYYLPAAGG